MEIDYEKAYKAVLETATQWIKDGCTDKEKICLESVFPELRESGDERIRKSIMATIEQCPDDFLNPKNRDRMLAWLEKQKDASKAIEAIERIDKYIDAHTANAHDMDDSNPDKKYYQGWDDALGKMAGILQDVYSNEKQKESLHISEMCKENADSFTDGIIEVRSFQRGIEEGRRREKQKEQTSDIILKAFENSKTDYSLEEREEASDYSEKVLPTSIACGESDEEFLLHKVIEAAYIAGQKEQKPPIAGNDFGWIDELKHDLEHPEELDEKVQEVLKKRQKPVEQDVEKYPEDKSFEDEWKDYYNSCLVSRLPMNKREVAKHFYWLAKKNAWKPSEEQMDRLFSIETALREDYCYHMADFLANLYADLKKLI